jgi:hypothetical protein
MRTKARAAVFGAAITGAALLSIPAASAADTGTSDLDSHCARQFEEAQRVDMESFRDFDKETWVAGHDDDAIAIFTTGLIVQGRDRIGTTMAGHFANRNATWTWTELNRAVDGCKAASIVYDATYAIPSQGFVLREIVSVSYTYKRGQWLSTIDQGTEIPAA